MTRSPLSPLSALAVAAALSAHPHVEAAPARTRPPVGAGSPPAVARPSVPPDAGEAKPWSEGRSYRLQTAPERVSEIALQPGESLVSVAAGDTARWVIGDTTSGSGAERRTHILVKPTQPGLRTNLVIATDRRVYHVELDSSGRAGIRRLLWTYAEDALLAVRGSHSGSGAVGDPVLRLEALNFRYRIAGDKPSWRPLRVFDDGQQVFIEFPPDLATMEAPPLFVTGPGGQTELVNYRVRGPYYVVDRLFAAAELRLGGKKQQVVRIVRADGARRTRKGRGRT